MINSENIETLKQVPIFKELRSDIIALILENSNLVKKQTGEYFFREKDLADCMYILRSGVVEVTRNWNNRTYHITKMGRSECFGEMAIVDQQTRSANVRALSSCDAIELNIDAVQAIYQHDLKQYAVLQSNLAKEVSRRLREANDLLFVAHVENEKNDIFFHSI